MGAGDCYRAKPATISFRCETNGTVGDGLGRPVAHPAMGDDAMCNAERRQVPQSTGISTRHTPPHAVPLSPHQPALV
jgi:hypothetical protein